MSAGRLRLVQLAALFLGPFDHGCLLGGHRPNNNG
jgi:hypothetical protein